MPTAASDAGCIEVYAENPVHWLTVRPPEIGRHWEKHGTRLRSPPYRPTAASRPRQTADCRSSRAEHAPVSCATVAVYATCHVVSTWA